MNKKKLFIGLVLSTVLISCSGEEKTEKTENENTDETVIVEETNKESGEESTPVAFMGEEKGEYLLYGHSEFSADEAVSTEEMFTAFNNNNNFEGAVKVTINEVCQNAGCWINIVKPNSDETVMVFFRDHYTIPIETSAGKEAILYGKLVSDTLTVDFQKHLLDDAAANGEEVPQEEYDAITEDKISQSFDCESILIKK
ncbi:MAG TPA: DUF4920 domain-containing protein [Crocinitomix sp.]|nr:DUF4920 domain-containing protein [Crocinitomix sp.]